jgi:hypothetical protein
MTGLHQAVDDYLRLRRSLGHQMNEAAYLLPDFAAFLDGRGEQTVTVAAALDWVKVREPEVITTSSPRRITAVRGFARYLSGIDPATEVPPMGLVPYRRRRGQIFLYSEADVAAIMAAARRRSASRCGRRPITRWSGCWPQRAFASARRSSSIAATSTGPRACCTSARPSSASPGWSRCTTAP